MYTCTQGNIIEEKSFLVQHVGAWQRPSQNHQVFPAFQTIGGSGICALRQIHGPMDFQETPAISCRTRVSLVAASLAVSKIMFSEDLRKEKTMKYDNKCTEWFTYDSKSAMGEIAKCNTNTKVKSVDEAHFLPPTILCPAIPDKGGELLLDV